MPAAKPARWWGSSEPARAVLEARGPEAIRRRARARAWARAWARAVGRVAGYLARVAMSRQTKCGERGRLSRRLNSSAISSKRGV